MPPTPANIEGACSGKAVCYDFEYVRIRSDPETSQNGLKCGSPDAEKHQDIHYQKLVVSGHDTVVKGRECRNRVRLLPNQ